MTGEEGRQRPFLSGKGAEFFDRKRVVAARRATRRRTATRPHGKRGRSGRRSWLRAWPSPYTQKGGKNAGKQPSYRADRLVGDPGQTAGQKGAWPYPDSVRPREAR